MLLAVARYFSLLYLKKYLRRYLLIYFIQPFTHNQTLVDPETQTQILS